MSHNISGQNDFIISFSKELRTINESEIGFALLYKSIDSYCNPKSGEGTHSYYQYGNLFSSVAALCAEGRV